MVQLLISVRFRVMDKQCNAGKGGIVLKMDDKIVFGIIGKMQANLS
jgi:hypothetical protein